MIRQFQIKLMPLSCRAGRPQAQACSSVRGEPCPAIRKQTALRIALSFYKWNADIQFQAYRSTPWKFMLERILQSKETCHEEDTRCLRRSAAPLGGRWFPRAFDVFIPKPWKAA